MTKRFTKYVPDSYNYTSVITIVDHETNKRSGSIDDFVDMMNALHEENEQLKQEIGDLGTAHAEEINKIEDEFDEEILKLKKENEQLKQQLEYQQEGIVDAIDSLMELPSATIYLLKQWIDAFEEYDSIEDMKNTFSKRIKELEE